MNHISLFNGIGGFQLAAHWMGWNNVMSCEIDDFCNSVTKYYFPNCKQYEDIRKTDFSIWRGRTDILTGGFPCQPFSNAGNKRGTNDDRYLWPEMLRAIEQSNPTWIVGENVTGILTMEDQSGISKEVFPKMESRTIIRYQEIDVYEAIYTRYKTMLVTSICEDLERIGYEVQPMAIPAASVGAPHRRERIWFLAHRNSERCDFRSDHRKRGSNEDHQKRNTKEDQPKRNRWKSGISSFRENRTATHAKNKRREYQQEQEQRQSGRSNMSIDSARATSDTTRIRQWGESDRKRETKFLDKDSEITNWRNFPTETPICNGDDGLSNRLDTLTFSKWRRESIKAAGNAIVPQVALELFDKIDQIEKDLI